MTSQYDSTDLIALIVPGALIVLAIIIAFIARISGIMNELRYINMEINRTSGREQTHWIKQRRRLWLSVIPFFSRK